MLEVAKATSYGCTVSLWLGDAYRLASLGGGFDGGLANYWLSHVPAARMDAFLKGFHRRVRKGSTVFMADNAYDPSVGGKLVKKPGDENTYRLRVLGNGTSHLIPKNYFSERELLGIFERQGARVEKKDVFRGKHYWFLSYTV